MSIKNPLSGMTVVYGVAPVFEEPHLPWQEQPYVPTPFPASPYAPVTTTVTLLPDLSKIQTELEELKSALGDVKAQLSKSEGLNVELMEVVTQIRKDVAKLSAKMPTPKKKSSRKPAKS